MEATTELKNALDKLKFTKRTLEKKISSGKNEILKLQANYREIQNSIDTLNETIKSDEEHLVTLLQTIETTDKGYTQLIDSAKTLIKIISQNNLMDDKIIN